MSNENGPAPRVNEGTGPEKIAAKVTSAAQSSGQRARSAPLTLAALSAALRDYGIHRANENADAWWRCCFDAGVDYLAATGREWTTDDIFALGVPAPDHPNRVGARIWAAHRAGVIRPTGYRLSSRPSRHAGVVRVWTGADTRTATLPDMAGTAGGDAQ